MIKDRSEVLQAFHAQHFVEQVSNRLAKTNGHHSELTDEEVIELARGAKNGGNFEPL